MNTHSSIWRNCGSCKGSILFGAKYYFCIISSCRKSAYCSMPCFDDHLGVFRHRDAWAEERVAPKETDGNSMDLPQHRTENVRGSDAHAPGISQEILVVVSKLKEYVQARAEGMNTSGGANHALSQIIRKQCDGAIEHARRDGRKTVMERDFSL